MSPYQALHRLASCAASGLHPPLRLPSRALLLHRSASRSSVLLSASLFGPSALPPTMASADFWLPISTPFDVDSARQVARSPRVLHTLFHAYARRIYGTAFRTRTGLCKFMPAYPTVTPLSASCSSRQRFASGFLQTPSRPGNPCRAANTSPCRVCRGLTPPRECALPGAHEKMAEPTWTPPFLPEHYLQTKVICTATASKRPSAGPGRARGESLRASSRPPGGNEVQTKRCTSQPTSTPRVAIEPTFECTIWITSFSCRGLFVGAGRPPRPRAPSPYTKISTITAAHTCQIGMSAFKELS
jgi:hypothetical protein